MNDGFINEKELMDYIDRKKYNELNENIKNFLSSIFKDKLESSLPFTVEKVAGQAKPDLCINHNDIKKYISVKKGSGNSVHQESIQDFFPYIKELLGNTYLNYLKKFHYGDDTIDDTGKIRYNANECKSRYKHEISLLNIELNKDSSLMKNFLYRFLFTGNAKNNLTVDIVYHGTIDTGLWATRDEIIDYIINNTFNKNTVHFGPLTYQVWGRNEKGTAIHPERRYVMQIKWSSITNDLSRIRRGINNV